MARSFARASSRYMLKTTTPAVVAVPLTIAAWYKSTGSYTTAQMIASLGRRTTAVSFFNLGVTTGGFFRAETCLTTTRSLATGTVSVGTGVWHHGCAVFTGVASRDIYTDGADKQSNTTSTTPTSINGFQVGVGYPTTAATLGEYADGDICEVGVWNVALSATDIANLAAGMSPLLVRPDALKHYIPASGFHSTEVDWGQTPGLTLTNSPGTSTDEPYQLQRVRPVWQPWNHWRTILPVDLAATVAVASPAATVTPYLTPAAPAVSYVAAGAVAQAASGNVTPALPAGIQTGDVLLLCLESADNVTSTLPAGWTKRAETNQGTYLRQTIASDVYTSGDSAPLVTHAAGNAVKARIFAFRNVDTAATDGVDQIAAQGNASTTTCTAPTVTPSVANSMLVFVGSEATNADTSNAPTWASYSGADPASWTEVDDSAYEGGSNEIGGAVAYGVRASTAATGTRTATITGAGASTVNVGALVVLKALTYAATETITLLAAAPVTDDAPAPTFTTGGGGGPVTVTVTAAATVAVAGVAPTSLGWALTQTSAAPVAAAAPAPSIQRPLAVSAAASVAVAGVAPASIGWSLTVSAAAPVVVAAPSPGAAWKLGVAADAQVSVAGVAASIQRPVTITTAAPVAVAGVAPSLAWALTQTSAAPVTVAGVAPTISAGVILSVSAPAAATTDAPAPSLAWALAGATGAVSVAGVAPTIQSGKIVVVSSPAAVAVDALATSTSWTVGATSAAVVGVAAGAPTLFRALSVAAAAPVSASGAVPGLGWAIGAATGLVLVDAGAPTLGGAASITVTAPALVAVSAGAASFLRSVTAGPAGVSAASPPSTASWRIVAVSSGVSVVAYAPVLAAGRQSEQYGSIDEASFAAIDGAAAALDAFSVVGVESYTPGGLDG